MVVINLRALQRTCTVMTALFAAVHIASHLTALRGVAAHIAFMETARVNYRQPAVEFVLQGCFALQVASELWLAARGWRQRRGGLARL